MDALDAVNARIISPLSTDVKSRKLIGVRKETMEKALNSLSIKPKVLAKRSNAIWDILLATKQEAKQLAENILEITPLSLRV